MIKKIYIIVAFILLVAFSPYNSKVYICGPQGAKKYHYSSSCRGFSACKQQINEVSKDKAISLGLTLCGWED
jgi:hypothetical protein